MEEMSVGVTGQNGRICFTLPLMRYELDEVMTALSFYRCFGDQVENHDPDLIGRIESQLAVILDAQEAFANWEGYRDGDDG